MESFGMDPAARERQQKFQQRATDEAFARVDNTVVADDLDAWTASRRHRADDTHLRCALKPHSCQHCQLFFIDNSGPKQTFMGGAFLQPKLLDFSLVTLASLKEAALDGCSFCASIVDNIDPKAREDHDEKDSDLSCFAWCDQGAGGTLDIGGLSAFGIWNRNIPWSKMASKDSHYKCLVSADDPASAFITSRPINIDPASEASFALYRSWLANCRNGHSNCEVFTSVFRPLRLIEISDEAGILNLRLSEDKDGPVVDYTALSYRWGQSQLAATTISNVEQRKTGLDIDGLPLTIQDAIKVTARLGLRYIWVDSICILQDLPQDKIMQIARMPEIYQNSTVTISTSRALYADDGFLIKRIPTEDPASTVTLPYLSPSTDEVGNVILFKPPTDLDISVLEDRGWTLQEHVLSPRVLDFSGSTTRWFCSTGWEKDGFRICPLFPEADKFRANALGFTAHKRSGGRIHHRLDYAKAANFWEDVVVEFTRRQLSVESDRSLAVAALAEVCADAFSTKGTGGYLAGLWRSFFPWCLMWSMPIRKTGRLRRPASYQGPSWSWMSVNGGVHYGMCSKLDGGIINRMKLLDWSTELESEDAPCGSVTSGALVVSGKKLPGQWMRHDVDIDDFRSTFDLDEIKLDQRLGLNDTIRITMCPDAQEADWDDPSTLSIDVVLLEVGYEPEVFCDAIGAHGFVLRALEDGFFSRLGTFETRRKDFENVSGSAEEKRASRERGTKLWRQHRDIYLNVEEEVFVIV
jgi:hypothetical protein